MKHYAYESTACFDGKKLYMWVWYRRIWPMVAAVEAGRRSGALPQERERAWEAGSLG